MNQYYKVKSYPIYLCCLENGSCIVIGLDFDGSGGKCFIERKKFYTKPEKGVEYELSNKDEYSEALLKAICANVLSFTEADYVDEDLI